MKKTISVNIAGLLFHVEEDAYERLRAYLDNVRRYFARYEGQSEIVTDIEARIAEIFTGKLSDQRQVVTAEDVDDLIRTMGDVRDFQAAEDDASEKADSAQTDTREEPKTEKASRPLRRDNRRKVIGGVCAGIGHFLGADPVWIRVLLALLVLASYGYVIIAYLIAWAAIPGSDELEDQPSVKKLYRDQQTAALGGVASGLAHYMGIDRSILRIIFLVMACFGFGIVLYIILWIAVPEANSLTDRMTMKGESVTLDNIDRTVRNSAAEAPKAESTLARILLFPFRLLKRLLDHAGPVLRGIVKLIRVLTGLWLMVLAAVLIIALIVASGVFFGLINGTSFTGDWGVMGQQLPLEALRLTFPTLLLIAATAAVFIPSLLLLLLGLSLVIGRMVIGRFAGWTLAGLFLVCVAALSIMLPGTLMAFSKEATYTLEQDFPTGRKTTYLRGRDTGMESYQVISLDIAGHGGDSIRLIRQFEAHGASRKDALASAQRIEHQATRQDSLITIDTNIRLPEGTPFRAQTLRMTLLLPYGKPVRVDRHLLDLSNLSFTYGSDSSDAETLQADSIGIRCLTCPQRTSSYGNGTASNAWNLTGFTSVDASGAYDLRVIRGDAFAVYRKDGKPLEGLEDDYDIHVSDETLVIRHRNRFRLNLGKADVPTLIVQMPHLSELEATGAGKVFIDGFREETIALELSGAVKVNAAVDADHLDADITGASELELIGSGRHLEAQLSGASHLEAAGYRARTGDIEASGASSARVNVDGELETDVSAASKVENRGKGRKVEEE